MLQRLRLFSPPPFVRLALAAALLAACGPNKDPLGKTSVTSLDSAGDQGDQGDQGAASSGDTSASVTDDGGTDTSGSGVHGDCDEYLACIGAVLPDQLPQAEMTYGADGVCWENGAEMMKACTDACTAVCKNAKCGDTFVWAGKEQCDDGNVVGNDGCNANCTKPKLVFVTSGSWNGNLGGLTGGDGKCQTLANAAALGGTFKAWLSNNTNNPQSRFVKSTTGYALTTGKDVAKTWADGKGEGVRVAIVDEGIDQNMGQSVLDAAHLGKAALQHAAGARHDVRRAEGGAVRQLHVEGQRGLGHEHHLPAQVAGVARGGLAALLGADAADDDLPDTLLREPHVQARADQGAVAGLVHLVRSGEMAQALERLHQAAGQREGVARIAAGRDVEHAHDGQAQRLE